MISNNNYILNEIKHDIYMSGEQLEADNILTWNEIGTYVSKMLTDVEKRLKVGAKKYGEQVPIFESDSDTRDNLSEAIEEIQDCIVYCTALKIQTAELRRYNDKTTAVKKIEKQVGISLERMKEHQEKIQKNYVNEYTLNISSAITYLQHSYFLLKKAESIKSHININNTTSEEETT